MSPEKHSTGNKEKIAKKLLNNLEKNYENGEFSLIKTKAGKEANKNRVYSQGTKISESVKNDTEKVVKKQESAWETKEVLRKIEEIKESEKSIKKEAAQLIDPFDKEVRDKKESEIKKSREGQNLADIEQAEKNKKSLENFEKNKDNWNKKREDQNIKKEIKKQEKFKNIKNSKENQKGISTEEDVVIDNKNKDGVLESAENISKTETIEEKSARIKLEQVQKNGANLDKISEKNKTNKSEKEDGELSPMKKVALVKQSIREKTDRIDNLQKKRIENSSFFGGIKNMLNFSEKKEVKELGREIKELQKERMDLMTKAVYERSQRFSNKGMETKLDFSIAEKYAKKISENNIIERSVKNKEGGYQREEMMLKFENQLETWEKKIPIKSYQNLDPFTKKIVRTAVISSTIGVGLFSFGGVGLVGAGLKVGTALTGVVGGTVAGWGTKKALNPFVRIIKNRRDEVSSEVQKKVESEKDLDKYIKKVQSNHYWKEMTDKVQNTLSIAATLVTTLGISIEARGHIAENLSENHLVKNPETGEFEKKDARYFGGINGHEDGELYTKTLLKNVIQNISNYFENSENITAGNMPEPLETFSDKTGKISPEKIITSEVKQMPFLLVEKNEGVGGILDRAFDFGEKGHMWGDAGAVSVLKNAIINNPDLAGKFNIQAIGKSDDFTNTGFEIDKKINIFEVKKFLEEKGFELKWDKNFTPAENISPEGYKTAEQFDKIGKNGLVDSETSNINSENIKDYEKIFLGNFVDEKGLYVCEANPSETLNETITKIFNIEQIAENKNISTEVVLKLIAAEVVSGEITDIDQNTMNWGSEIKTGAKLDFSKLAEKIESESPQAIERKVEVFEKTLEKFQVGLVMGNTNEIMGGAKTLNFEMLDKRGLKIQSPNLEELLKKSVNFEKWTELKIELSENLGKTIAPVKIESPRAEVVHNNNVVENYKNADSDLQRAYDELILEKNKNLERANAGKTIMSGGEQQPAEATQNGNKFRYQAANGQWRTTDSREKLNAILAQQEKGAKIKLQHNIVRSRAAETQPQRSPAPAPVQERVQNKNWTKLPNGTYIDRASGQRFSENGSEITNQNMKENTQSSRVANQAPTQPRAPEQQDQPKPEIQKGFYKQGYHEKVGDSSLGVYGDRIIVDVDEFKKRMGDLPKGEIISKNMNRIEVERMAKLTYPNNQEGMKLAKEEARKISASRYKDPFESNN